MALFFYLNACIEHTLYCSESISTFWITLVSTVYSKVEIKDVTLYGIIIGSNSRPTLPALMLGLQ